jgi:hypothetical protein
VFGELFPWIILYLGHLAAEFGKQRGEEIVLSIPPAKKTLLFVFDTDPVGSHELFTSYPALGVDCRGTAHVDKISQSTLVPCLKVRKKKCNSRGIRRLHYFAR